MPVSLLRRFAMLCQMTGVFVRPVDDSAVVPWEDSRVISCPKYDRLMATSTKGRRGGGQRNAAR